MTYRGKIIALLLLLATIPTLAAGMLSSYTSEDEIRAGIVMNHETSANLVSSAIDDYVSDAIEAIRMTVTLIPFHEFAPGELRDAVRIPYRQFDFVNIAGLYRQDGEPLVVPIYRDNPADLKALGKHEGITPETARKFVRHVPIEAVAASDLVLSNIYRCPKTRAPRFVLAVAVPSSEPEQKWVLALEMTLIPVEKLLRRALYGQYSAVFLVDGQGRLVGHNADRSRAIQRDWGSLSIVERGLKTKRLFSTPYVDHGGAEMLGAFAWVATPGWGLVVAQSAERAFTPVSRMRLSTLIWVVLGVLVAVFGGIVFSKGVTQPVRELARGAELISNEKFDQKILVRSSDEIGALAESFNTMAAKLKASFETIREKNREIEGWNAELQRRVDKRTAELKAAQGQIIVSQKLAAVGNLSAGIAHEISNPLTGILGYAELLLNQADEDSKEHESLSRVVEQSRRIRKIIDDLSKFSQSAADEDFQIAELNWVVSNTLPLIEGQLLESKIELNLELESALPSVRCNPSELQQAILHILSNAKSAMPNGGRLTLKTGRVEGGALKLEIVDTGVGIRKEDQLKIFDPFYTTKREWTQRGLGLFVANRIVSEHDGKIVVNSTEGQGSSFSVILPGVERVSHLS